MLSSFAALLPLIAGAALITYAFYKWATQHNDYFTRCMPSLPYLQPRFLLGTTGAMMLGTQHLDEWCKWVYRQLPQARIVGLFMFRKPMFMVRDPELIKQVCRM